MASKNDLGDSEVSGRPTMKRWKGPLAKVPFDGEHGTLNKSYSHLLPPKTLDTRRRRPSRTTRRAASPGTVEGLGRVT